MAEIMGCIFYNHLKFDPKNPEWEDRDKLILSKGHASPGLFSNMAVAGYFEESQLDTLRQFGSKLQGHPDLKCPGVEFCGGSLGIGLSYSIGNALAAKLDQKDTHIFTVMGDGESDEGQVWEAAMTAAKYNVDNLTLILDRNFIQQDSYTEKIMPLDESLDGDELSEMWKDASRWKTGDKWRSFGWNVIEVDGHRIEQISDALDRAKSVKGMPSIIIARTIKGKAVEHMEDNPQWHGKAPNPTLVPVINDELDSQFMIAPSIIAGDMTNLENEVKRCDDGRADYIHLDVMDGHFVPNSTFDYTKIKELRPLTVIPFDTHLMINEPVRQIQNYIDGSVLTISDAPWPGFTPDLLSVVLVVATQAKGSVLIHQKMFESRLFFVDKLIDMGAQIILCDPHRATVIGLDRKIPLKGIQMTSPDIRAGVSLLIAALSAKGESIIDNIEQIDRGYSNIDTRLKSLGADIERI